MKFMLHKSLVFYVMFCRSLFVLFLLVILSKQKISPSICILLDHMYWPWLGWPLCWVTVMEHLCHKWPRFLLVILSVFYTCFFLILVYLQTFLRSVFPMHLATIVVMLLTNFVFLYSHWSLNSLRITKYVSICSRPSGHSDWSFPRMSGSSETVNYIISNMAVQKNKIRQ
jgi:hypothetical protein